MHSLFPAFQPATAPVKQEPPDTPEPEDPPIETPVQPRFFTRPADRVFSRERTQRPRTNYAVVLNAILQRHNNSEVVSPEGVQRLGGVCGDSLMASTSVP